jgi:hypothetical protein
MMRFSVRFAPLALLIGAALGCVDQDPFRLSDRTILGDFYLHRFETGSFYLCHENRDCSGHGVLNGTVRSIGWNERYILVWQNPDAGEAGWVVIDSQSDTITGPFDDEHMASQSAVVGVRTLEASVAWKKLGGA